jgi:hypothetical protein
MSVQRFSLNLLTCGIQLATRMVNNEHHESQVIEMQLLRLETQIIYTKVLNVTQFVTQLVDI